MAGDRVARAYARRWRLGALAAAVVASLAAWVLVPASPVTIPASDGASSVLWPLVPTMVAVVAPTVLLTAYDDLERTAAVAGVVLRGLALVTCIASAAVVTAGAVRFDPAVVARNAMLLMGLATAATALVPPGIAWTPVVLTPLVMWLLGTDPATRVRHDWAVLLAPAGSATAWVAAVTVGLGGAACYLVRGGVTSGWWPRAGRSARA